MAIEKWSIFENINEMASKEHKRSYFLAILIVQLYDFRDYFYNNQRPLSSIISLNDEKWLVGLLYEIYCMKHVPSVAHLAGREWYIPCP